MDLLLFNLSCKKPYHDNMKKDKEFQPSLGLLSIATYAKLHNYTVGVHDYNFEEFSYNHLAELLITEQPKLVGITVYTENAIIVGRIANFIKNVYPETHIFVGGPHASLFPTYFNKYKSIDFVELGEGESNTIIRLWKERRTHK